MIAKIISGHGFAGLVSYANDIKDKDTRIVAYRDVNLSSNATISASFMAQARARPTVSRPVGHIVLSFSPDDKPRLSDALMAEIAAKYLQRMGIVGTPFVMFRHMNQPHDHLHIVYSRVDNEARAVTADTNFRRSVSVTRALTREYGLSFGHKKRYVRRDRLRGKDRVKYRIFDAVNGIAAHTTSWQTLRRELREQGTRMEFLFRKDGTVRGVTFTADDVRFAGGRIDSTLSFASLCQTFTRDLTEAMAEQAEEIAGSIATATTGFISTAADIILTPPTVTPTLGGGGSASDSGWSGDDDDDENDNKKRRTYKHRR